jgi:hypothetical protein
MAAVLRKAAKNDGHYIADDQSELEELSTFFGSVMNAIDATLELEYQKEREFERQIPSLIEFKGYDVTTDADTLQGLNRCLEALQGQRLTDEA